MNTPQKKLGELIAKNRKSINPSKHPDELFDLYSVPSYFKLKPEIVRGRDIGSSKQIVRTNDVLLCKIVPHIRRSWVVGPSNDRRTIASSEWIVFRGENFYPEYLKHFLLSDRFHARFMQTVSGVGGSLLRARPEGVKRIRIPLPSISEQKRIADILNKANAIRRKRVQTIQLADEFLRSAFLEMFGDPVKNPKGWKHSKLEDALISIEAGCSVKGENRVRLENEWGVLKVSSVTWGRFLRNECKVVPKKCVPKKQVLPKSGDLLFSRANTRDLVAATCIVENDEDRLFLPDKLWKITTDREILCHEYIHFVFSHRRFRKKITRQATGTSGSMLNISQQKLKNIWIPVPPKKIQNEFKKVFWKSIETKSKMQQSSQKEQILFDSLSQRAFRGDL